MKKIVLPKGIDERFLWIFNPTAIFYSVLILCVGLFYLFGQSFSFLFFSEILFYEEGEKKVIKINNKKMKSGRVALFVLGVVLMVFFVEIFLVMGAVVLAITYYWRCFFPENKKVFLDEDERKINSLSERRDL